MKKNKDKGELTLDDVTGWWETDIVDIAPGSIRIRGYAIEELIGRISFPAMIWLVLRGELPSKAFIDGAAKNRMWCQNIPSRHQIRASGPHETTRNERDDASD